MALATSEVRVGALQLEVCLLTVLEKPYTPAVRVVALPAIGAKRGFVFIVFLMAGIAIRSGLPESGREMAFLAGRRGVHAQKGESSQVVVK